VPDRASPSVRRRRLAAELRRLRERAGLTGEEVAERLGWSNSKVSRIELHRIGVKQADLRSLLDVYGVSQQRRDELLALARESAQKSWLQRITAGLPADDAEYLHAEAEARSVWDWEPQVVAGHLQTPDYARAVMAGPHSVFGLPPGDAELRVEARLARQQALTRDPPLELSVVMDESVLRRRFGSDKVMRQQLNRLIEASELPNVDLRILPLAGSQPVVTGAFLYFSFSQVHKVSLHDIVTVEYLTGNHYIEDEQETYEFRRSFERLTAEAFDPANSREVIAKIAREAWG
jgi:transcriptional regulator with XRE-family HTH domain